MIRDSHIRSGGYAVPALPKVPNNRVGQVKEGHYEALYQCAGPRATEFGTTNFWWVKINLGQDTGWISAINIGEGGDDEPIPDVPTQPTVFE